MPADDPPSSLAPWLVRHAAGDPAAHDAVLRHCQARLKVLTRQMLRRFPGVQRWEETSDVFQNVLVRLDRALRAVTFDTPADFLRLAAAHVRRELIDLSRHHRAAAVLKLGGGDGSSDPGPAEGESDTTHDPYRLAQWHELHTRIAALPDDDRRLFDLLYYQGLTLAEASGLLGVPVRTLKRQWQAARLRLVAAFGNEPPF